MLPVKHKHVHIKQACEMARPKSTGEIKSHQQHLLMTPTEVAQIDEWRFRNHIGSRGEAIRRLCQNGLTVQEDIELALEEASDIWDRLTEFHSQLWSIDMQIRGRHEHANPALPAREWTAEDVVDRTLDWTSDLVDQCRVLYLDLLSLNNRVYSMSEPGSFAEAQREVVRQKEVIDAQREEVFRRLAESRDNRRLGLVIHWMDAHPEQLKKYEALSDVQKDEFLNRSTEHIRAAGEAAISFDAEEQASVRRRNDQPYDLEALADFIAAQVLFRPSLAAEQYLRFVKLHFPNADETMVAMMITKAKEAAAGRDISMP